MYVYMSSQTTAMANLAGVLAWLEKPVADGPAPYGVDGSLQLLAAAVLEAMPRPRPPWLLVQAAARQVSRIAELMEHGHSAHSKLSPSQLIGLMVSAAMLHHFINTCRCVNALISEHVYDKLRHFEPPKHFLPVQNCRIHA